MVIFACTQKLITNGSADGLKTVTFYLALSISEKQLPNQDGCKRVELR